MARAGKWREFGGGHSLVGWAVAALALTPALLFMLLGAFSRMMGDDWGHFATALHLGGRDYFQFWWNERYTSFAYILFHKALAPLGPENLPPLFPAIIIALWLIGLAGLMGLCFRALNLARCRWSASVALAGGLLGATLHALYTWESIYWYSASARYSLPYAIFLLYLAAALHLARRPLSTRQMALAALGAAVLCFVNAAFSEMQLVIQLTYLLCFCALLRFFPRGGQRDRSTALIAAGWLGSALSLLVQLTSPAIAARMFDAASLGDRVPIRALPTLLAATAQTVLEYLGHQGALAGFTLMLVFGLTATLLLYRPRGAGLGGGKLSLAPLPIAIALAAQLCFAPALWRPASDLGGALATSSLAAAVPRCLNPLFIALLALLLLRRARLCDWLAGRAWLWTPLSAALLALALTLLATTQWSALRPAGAFYLFVCALSALGLLSSALRSLETETHDRRFSLAPLLALSLALLTLALQIALGWYSIGAVYPRLMVAAAQSQALAGLVCGAYIGFLLRRASHGMPGGPVFAARIAALGAMLLAGALLAVALFLAALVPDFATYAREWDARRDRIIEQRESGARHIEVAPYSFDMTAYIAANGRHIGGSDAYFFAVDAIVEATS